MRRLRKLAVLLAVAGLFPLALAGSVPAAAVPQVTKTITLHDPSSLSSFWGRVSAIGYGSATAKLGTSLGGDGAGIFYGPSYGTQTPDKTWWYLDTAKARLAHYSPTGAYLGQVKIPAADLTDGIYVQYQNPQALKNGSLVLMGTDPAGPTLLLMSRTHHFTKVKLKQAVAIHSNDGTYLYGSSESGKTVRITPTTGKIVTVTWLRGQGGRRFSLAVGNGTVTIRRPGANLKLKLVSAEHPTKTPHAQLEAAMGADGRLWVLISAIVEISATTSVDSVGLVSIKPSGAVSAVQRLRPLTSVSDPADGQHLGIRYGGTKLWLMFIDTDAARVYRLT